MFFTNEYLRENLSQPQIECKSESLEVQIRQLQNDNLLLTEKYNEVRQQLNFLSLYVKGNLKNKSDIQGFFFNTQMKDYIDQDAQTSLRQVIYDDAVQIEKPSLIPQMITAVYEIGTQAEEDNQKLIELAQHLERSRNDYFLLKQQHVQLIKSIRRGASQIIPQRLPELSLEVLEFPEAKEVDLPEITLINEQYQLQSQQIQVLQERIRILQEENSQKYYDTKQQEHYIKLRDDQINKLRLENSNLMKQLSRVSQELTQLSKEKEILSNLTKEQHILLQNQHDQHINKVNSQMEEKVRIIEEISLKLIQSRKKEDQLVQQLKASKQALIKLESASKIHDIQQSQMQKQYSEQIQKICTKEKEIEEYKKKILQLEDEGKLKDWTIELKQKNLQNQICKLQVQIQSMQSNQKQDGIQIQLSQTTNLEQIKTLHKATQTLKYILVDKYIQAPEEEQQFSSKDSPKPKKRMLDKSTMVQNDDSKSQPNFEKKTEDNKKRLSGHLMVIQARKLQLLVQQLEETIQNLHNASDKQNYKIELLENENKTIKEKTAVQINELIKQKQVIEDKLFGTEVLLKRYELELQDIRVQNKQLQLSLDESNQELELLVKNIQQKSGELQEIIENKDIVIIELQKNLEDQTINHQQVISEMKAEYTNKLNVLDLDNELQTQQSTIQIKGMKDKLDIMSQQKDELEQKIEHQSHLLQEQYNHLASLKLNLKNNEKFISRHIGVRFRSKTQAEEDQPKLTRTVDQFRVIARNQDSRKVSSVLDGRQIVLMSACFSKKMKIQ